jgi:hypothetical protein
MAKFTVFTVFMVACLAHAALAQQASPHTIKASLTISSSLTTLRTVLENQTAVEDLRAALTRDLFRILQLNEETLTVVDLTRRTTGGGRLGARGSRTSLLSAISVVAQTEDRATLITARLIALPSAASNLSDTVAIFHRVSSSISTMVVGDVTITPGSTQDGNSVQADTSNGGCHVDTLFLLPAIMLALVCAHW